MTKLKLDILRRIENLSEMVGIKPKVGRTSENHLDDSWEDTKIYKGELFINLKDKHLYTSDGKYILNLNQPKNYILNGLKIKKPDTAGEGIALDIQITNGTAIINNKICKYESDEISNYQIDLDNTIKTESKICLLFAKPIEINDPNVQESDSLNIEFTQKIVSGTNILSDFDELNLKYIEPNDILYKLLYKNSDELGLTQYLNENYLLLGLVFIPANYNIYSYNLLEPLSLSNNNSTFPLQEKSYKDLLNSNLNIINVWEANKVFYKSQLIRDKNNLYIAHKTFNNGNEINITNFLLSDYLEDNDSDSDSDSDFLNADDEQIKLQGFLSKVNLDYTDPNAKIEGKQYWIKIIEHYKIPTNISPYKYIIGIVPNIDPTQISDLKTIDLPNITINGIQFTVGYNNTNKDISQLYFAKIGLYNNFDENNYSIEDLNNLEFAGREIKEGYYLIWNKDNIGYDYEINKFNVIMNYKL